MPRIQPTDHMELRRKEDQGVDASVLHRRRNRIIWEVEGDKDLGGRKEEKGNKGEQAYEIDEANSANASLSNVRRG